jgi:dihydroorotase-like cyclic amidohydrolase
MSEPRWLIVNARLVNEGREFDGDLRFATAASSRSAADWPRGPGETVIDAAGLPLLPGMIDDQVHFREPGMDPQGDMASESAAAVAGGMTSFMEMPNTVPPTDGRSSCAGGRNTVAPPAAATRTTRSTWARANDNLDESPPSIRAPCPG